jgi:hypothetical protein
MTPLDPRWLEQMRVRFADVERHPFEGARVFFDRAGAHRRSGPPPG